MAVTKIRKFSSTVLLIIAIITIIVAALFIFGGVIDPTVAKPEPRFTDLMFYTVYVVLAITLLAMIYFAIAGFAGKLKRNPRSAMMGLGAIVLLAILLIVTYAIGSTETLALSADSQKYNTDFYLKFSDMWLYSIYVLLGITILALLWGAVRNAIAKRS